MKHLFALLLLPVCAMAYNPGPPTNNSATPGPPGQAYVISITGTSAANGTITFAGSGVSQGGANGRTFTFNAGTATNGVNSVVNTTNAAGVVSLVSNILYIGTNALSLDTSAVLALINASTNVAARLASNVWSAADSTTNYVARTGGNYPSTTWTFGHDSGNAGVVVQTDLVQIGSGAGTYLQVNDTLGLLRFVGNMSAVSGVYIGDGSGITGLNGASITNLTTGSITNIIPGNGIEITSGSGPQVTVALSNGFTLAGGITITAGSFTGNGSGLTNVTASALNGNAAQSLLTNNLVIQGTGAVTVTTTTGGNITTATVSLATGGTLPSMDGGALTNLVHAHTNAIFFPAILSDGVGGTNLITTNSPARLAFAPLTNVSFFGFTGWPSNSAGTVRLDLMAGSRSFALDSTISNQSVVSINTNAGRVTILYFLKAYGETWWSVRQ